MSQTRQSPDAPVRESVIITGFPAFASKRLVAKILASDALARIHLLASRGGAGQAREFVATLPAGQAQRVAIVEGRDRDMDLGLSGTEYRALCADITTIHHLAGSDCVNVDARLARQINVDGTRNILEFAADSARLRRLCHWSTAAVSGKRRGIVLEDELDHGQTFHNPHEHARFEAEILARRAQRHLPVTILRPGVIVGDSKTGEIDAISGPYYLMVLIASNQTQIGLPLPGRGTAPLNLVPIDYVVDAAYALSMDQRAAGKTFHLTDPHPLSARRIFELVAERSGTRKPPRGYIPGRLSRALLRVPGLDRLARGPRSFVDPFDHHVFYNCRQTQELLASTGIRCPSFESYVDNLVHYIQTSRARRQPRVTDDEDDSLD